MYDQWNYLKTKQQLKISPFWRSFFGSLWAGALAGDVKSFLKKSNISVSYSSALIGISFFIINILYKLPDPYWLITFLSFLPLLPILDAMNQYYEENESDLPEIELAWWQIVLIGTGLTFLALVVFEVMNPS